MKDLSNQKQSRLELYVEVLKTLGEAQSLNIKAIQGITKIDRPILSAAMKFLEQQRLVQPRSVSNGIVYKNTSRGIRVFRYLSEGARVSAEEINHGVNLVQLQGR